jgi:hypothetical protein
MQPGTSAHGGSFEHGERSRAEQSACAIPWHGMLCYLSIMLVRMLHAAVTHSSHARLAPVVCLLPGVARLMDLLAQTEPGGTIIETAVESGLAQVCVCVCARAAQHRCACACVRARLGTGVRGSAELRRCHSGRSRVVPACHGTRCRAWVSGCPRVREYLLARRQRSF